MKAANMLFGCLTSLLCLFPSVLSADIITVRQDGTGDYVSIQAAINAAVRHDTVEVGPGTYFESVQVSEWNVTIRSSDGPEVTILDANTVGSHMALIYGGLVEGFTFRNAGSGSIRSGQSPTIRGCRFENNHAYRGGAIFIDGHQQAGTANLTAIDCEFVGNSAETYGGAVGGQINLYMNFTNCTFIGNTAPYGGALYLGNTGGNIDGCLFVANSASLEGGAILASLLGGNIRNCTFYANNSPDGSLYISAGLGPEVTRNIFAGDSTGAGVYYDTSIYISPDKHTCNVYWDNAAGPMYGDTLAATEIIGDPLFCGPTGGDFSLKPASPGAPVNSACGLLIGAFPADCVAVPATISFFQATPGQDRVILTWDIVTDEAISGFRVYRAPGGAVERHAVSDLLPNTTREFTDITTYPNVTYEYILAVLIPDGTEKLSAPQVVTIPGSGFWMSQNRPNPFNPSTSIQFNIPEQSRVTLTVFDVSGRPVAVLVDDVLAAGSGTATWNGKNANGDASPSGVYFYRLLAGKHSMTNKMVLLK